LFRGYNVQDSLKEETLVLAAKYTEIDSTTMRKSSTLSQKERRLK